MLVGTHEALLDSISCYLKKLIYDDNDMSCNVVGVSGGDAVSDSVLSQTPSV